MNSYIFPSKQKAGPVILSILLFCLSFLVLDRLLDHYLVPICQHWRPTTGAQGKNLLTDNIIDSDIMIIGSSRAYSAFDPDVLARQTGMTVRQESWKGKYIKYHYHFYQQYRKISKAPKILIWGLDYFLFAHGTEIPYLKRLGVLPGDSEPAPEPAGPDKKKLSLLPRVSHLMRSRPLIQGAVYDILNSYNQSDSSSGPKKYRNSKQHIQAEIEPAKYVHYPYHPFPGQEGEYLDDFLELLERDEVEIYLVFLPDYLGTKLSHAEEETYVRQWTEIAARHPQIRLLNFNILETFSLNNNNLFYDGGYNKVSSHLNSTGAAILSKKMASIIRKKDQD